MTVWTQPPRMGSAYLRALFQRKRPQPPFELPPDTAALGPLTLDEATLSAYRDVIGSTAAVPMAYPQLLVTPVHVHMLTAPAFPFPAMGLVHPRCVVRQLAPLHVGDTLSIAARIEGLREVRNGVEFDLVAEVDREGERVWESRAATFYRTGKSGGERPPEVVETYDSREAFEVPRDAGRRYARVSGDANPVHLHPLLSRLFGYKQPIAHGWWLLGRVLGALRPPQAALTLEMDLRRPVFMGETLTLGRTDDGGQTRFAVLDDRDKVRLAGRLAVA